MSPAGRTSTLNAKSAAVVRVKPDQITVLFLWIFQKCIKFIILLFLQFVRALIDFREHDQTSFVREEGV